MAGRQDQNWRGWSGGRNSFVVSEIGAVGLAQIREAPPYDLVMPLGKTVNFEGLHIRIETVACSFRCLILSFTSADRWPAARDASPTSRSRALSETDARCTGGGVPIERTRAPQRSGNSGKPFRSRIMLTNRVNK
jgi:hypothetical protein